MKKMIVVFLGVLFFAATVQAQTPNAKAPAAAPTGKIKKALIEHVQGKIDSLEKADEAKGNYGGFSMIDKEGKKLDIVLIPKTHVYTANSAPITYADLKKGDGVLVLYVVTLKGIKEAITITQTKP